MIKHLLSFIFISFLFGVSKSQTYALQWQTPVSSPKSMIVDSTGNSYVAEGNLIKKYDPLGAFVWQTLPISNSSINFKFNKAGEIVVAGTYTSSSAPLNDFFVCKIDVNGTILWSKKLDSLDLNNNYASFTIDNSDNIIVTGQTVLSASNSDVLTYKLNTAGNVIWCRSYSTAPLSGTDLAKVVVLDSLNNVFITATVKTSTTSVMIDSMAVLKYTSTGNFVSVKYFRGHPALNSPLYSLTHSVFFNSKLYVYYRYDNNLPGIVSSYFTLDSNLTNVNHYFLGGSGPFYLNMVMVMDVKSYDKENVLLTGGSSTVVLSSTGPSSYYPFINTTTGNGSFSSFGAAPGGATGIRLNNGNYVCSFADMVYQSMFFFVLNPAGTTTHTITTKPAIPMSNITTLYGLESDKSNSVFILYTNNSGSYLEKYAWTSSIEEKSENDIFSVFPNPGNRMFYIESNLINFDIEVYNSIGGKILVKENLKSKTELDLSSQPAGIYFVRVISAHGSTVKRIIKE